MDPIEISISAARIFHLQTQGLLHPPSAAPSKADVLALIRRMGYLQIDTIHVVARSPYLVLWSRLGDYPPAWLDELLAEGALFEFWAHAMCFLPVEDYRYHRRRMVDNRWTGTWPMKWAQDWLQDNPEMAERMRAYLRENGEVRSAEFENGEHTQGGWWAWKDEKNTLEALLLRGEVMVARRQSFQRVYALRERVLPGWEEAEMPSTEELQRWLDLHSVAALGIATPSWASDVFRQSRIGMGKRLAALVEEGQLVQAAIEDIKEPAYLLPESLAQLKSSPTKEALPGLTTLLSPFDPLVADRSRARALFGFDYQIECYLPQSKRRFSYFSLPILHRGRLVGRLDAKAHRAQGIFEVKSFHLEPGVAMDADLAEGLAGALRSLAVWHKTPELRIGISSPPEAAGALRSLL